MGDIRLTSTSYVKDDIICIWGKTEIDHGAQIAGRTNVFNFSKIFQDPANNGILSKIMVVFRFSRILLLFIVALIIHAAFPKHTNRIRERLSKEYVKTLVVGSIGIILLPVIFIILLATILGIPVAILFLPLLTIAGFLLGITAFCLMLGQSIRDRSGIKLRSSILLLSLGILAIELPFILGKAAIYLSPSLSILFLFLGFIIFITAWIPGFGAVILTRFGTRS